MRPHPPEEIDLLFGRVEAGELVQRRKDTQMAQHRHRSLLSNRPAAPDVYLSIPPATPESHKQPIPDRGNFGLVAVRAKNPVRLTGGAGGHHLEACFVRQAGTIELFLQDGLGQEGELLKHRFIVEIIQPNAGLGKGVPVVGNLRGPRRQATKPVSTKLPQTRRRAPLLSPARRRAALYRYQRLDIEIAQN